MKHRALEHRRAPPTAPTQKTRAAGLGLCAALGLGLGLAPAQGCTGRYLQPTTASSAGSAAYAEAYPQTLEAVRTRLADEKTLVQTLSAGLATRAQELKTPFDAQRTLSIIDAADEAGREDAFAATHRMERAVRAFWEEERGPISARVSGAVQQKAGEAKCDSAELTGPVPYAMREGVDRQLERRRRTYNEAHHLIERHKASLGPANASVLHGLADDIALDSYLAHVALIADANEIARMLDEQRQVASTLEAAIQQELEVQGEVRTTSERKGSAERLARLTKSRDALATAVTNAEGEIKTREAQAAAAQSEYKKALNTLRDEVRRLGMAR